jgi:hypothetical protein
MSHLKELEAYTDQQLARTLDLLRKINIQIKTINLALKQATQQGGE